MATAVSVKVAVRCRPMSSSEQARGSRCIVTQKDSTVLIENPENAGEEPRAFTFDNAYLWDSTQRQVYIDLAEPIISKAMEGFNGTIFAYGQTGSGKTYSMMGYDGDLGIIPLMNQDLFGRVDANTTPNKQFLITVSYLEIYNEVVNDLLNPSDKQLKVREHPDSGIYVEGLAELVVRSADHVASLIEQGNKVRQVAETNMNARSSRSHSCFTIKIEQRTVEKLGDTERETALHAKINLVDLAGSERADKTGATGARLKEGAAINKSLSALGDVIEKLASGKRGAHIPYRNSKLTRLLQESLGGNALTVMVATLSPADYNYDETLSTLKYANRAKNIKNETKKNEDVNERIIRELREEIETLRQQLGQMGHRSSTQPLSEEEVRKMKEMEAVISTLEHAKLQTWEEKERLSRMYEEERKKNMESVDRIRNVMESMREENMELLKRLRQLKQDKADLTREFRKRKEKNGALKASLERDMEKYEGLMAAAEAGEDKEADMAEVVQRIDAKRKKLLENRDMLTDLRERLKEVERLEQEERAKAAAQKMVLEGDEELRKKIQEEERERLEREREKYLATALEEARTKVMQETAQEKQRLLQRFQQGIMGEGKREQELELELIQEKADKNLLRLEMEEMRRRHAQELQQAQRVQRRETAVKKQEMLQVVRQMCEAFEEERRQMEEKYAQAALMLRQAIADIDHLRREKVRLEEALHREAAWEPRR